MPRTVCTANAAMSRCPTSTWNGRFWREEADRTTRSCNATWNERGARTTAINPQRTIRRTPDGFRVACCDDINPPERTNQTDNSFPFPSYLNKIPVLSENGFYYEYTNKIFSDSGVSHDIDPECFFIDGMKFVFEGNFKIIDKNRDPLSCYWDVHKVGHVRACPVVSFRVYLPSGVKWFYTWPEKEWVANEWNHYYFDFIAVDGMYLCYQFPICFELFSHIIIFVFRYGTAIKCNNVYRWTSTRCQRPF